MTLPTFGPLDMQAINNEFGLGYDLANYRGVQWWTDGNVRGTFDVVNLDMSEFYGKRRTTPVVPGSRLFTSSADFQIPHYNTLVVTMRSGGGGGAGGSGNVAPGGAGGLGGYTTFDIWAAADPGRGGNPGGVPGANGAGADGLSPGGAGGSAALFGVPGGAGGAGGVTTVVWTWNNGGAGPPPGYVVHITIGQGGLGGSGGFTNYNGQVVLAGPGGNGAQGMLSVSWG